MYGLCHSMGLIKLWRTFMGRSTPSDGSNKVHIVADFIYDQMIAHRHRCQASGLPGPVPPLFVGVQGPQGAGKSFVTDLVPRAIQSMPRGLLRTVTLSLDDLYLTHDAQRSLAVSNPANVMLSGRGPPGTHDLALADKIFKGLKAINEAGAGTVSLPRYDKSAFSGEGDRSPDSVAVEGPVDVVILEGWCVGFRPTGQAELRRRYEEALEARKTAPADRDTRPATLAKRTTPFLVDHSLEALTAIDEALQSYLSLWDSLDAFVELHPKSNYIWQWRLEQEHAMKAGNGGKGMTDEQVGAFIARYMPCYELFGVTPLARRHLRLVLDRRRDVVRTERL